MSWRTERWLARALGVAVTSPLIVWLEGWAALLFCTLFALMMCALLDLRRPLD